MRHLTSRTIGQPVRRSRPQRLTLDTDGRHIQRTGHDHVVAALDKLVR